MKIITILSLLLFSVTSFSQDDGQEKSKEEVTQSSDFEQEVIRRVKEEVKAKLEKLKPGNVLNFSKQLLEKEEQLKLRELEIAKREEELGLAKREVEKKIKEFQGQQQKAFVVFFG